MSRASRWLLGRFLVTWSVVLTIAAAVVGTALEIGDAAVWPSPWCAVGPTAAVAAVWTVRRARRRGEDVALAQGGATPALAVVPCLLATAAVLAVAGSWTGRVLPAAVPATGPAASVGLDGDLLVVDAADRAIRWRADAARPDPPRPRGAVTGFTPVPTSELRFALRLLIARPPWNPAPLDRDPTRLRWLFALLSVVVPAVILSRCGHPRR